MKKLSIINENIFDGIGKRSKGGIVRKENYVEQVDLGLPSGTIWAACNLGASSPEEYGDYYAWGETEPKDKYTLGNYKFETQHNFIKNFEKYNKEDGKIILDPEDDAAHVVLGGKWHMPTKKQIEELVENATNEESELNGVKGRLFTSKINDNTLFFPYSGYKSGGDIIGKGKLTYYWSSSINEKYPDNAISIDSDYYDRHKSDDWEKFSSEYRYRGLCIRGVFKKK